ncbi:phage head morphogenesis protein [Pseudoalteromonas mariniglutinosa]
MAVRYGSLPFDDGINFFRQKLNTPSASWDDVWQSAHNRAFMVAGVTKADMLNDFYTSVEKAISEGKSLNWFQKRV